ncbi:Uncharacterised protein [Mycobacteroides abscessus subsp. bolletii]|nr:Uncharacterised protein [Mycobacteroides abscessus subsp. bolletii]
MSAGPRLQERSLMSGDGEPNFSLDGMTEAERIAAARADINRSLDAASTWTATQAEAFAAVLHLIAAERTEFVVDRVRLPWLRIVK